MGTTVMCKRVSQLSAVRAAVIALVVCVLTVSGCQGNGDVVRAALATREVSWQRELGTLRSQQAALWDRFGRQRTAVSAGAASEKRVRASLGGMGQSLVDVEAQLRQVAPQIEKALGRGSDEANRTLEEESARMNGYLQALAADLVSAGQELDEFGRSEPAKNAQVE